MGACEFFTVGYGNTAKEAFDAAVKQAQYLHGHGGYTGTIAEKRDFTVIEVPGGKDPEEYAAELMESDDHWVYDKWGPAGCVYLGPKERYGYREKTDAWLFFGYASY